MISLMFALCVMKVNNNNTAAAALVTVTLWSEDDRNA